MTAAFFAYIKTITAFLLFVAFGEMLLPQSSLKKYVVLVFGMLLMITVLKPIITIFHKGEEASFFSAVEEETVPLESEAYYKDLAKKQELEWTEISLSQEIETKVAEALGEEISAQVHFSEKDSKGEILLEGSGAKQGEIEAYVSGNYPSFKVQWG